ncbi:hypothetical protein E3983_11545 [Legionella israelensis]|uniref:Effector protein B, substrate of the Dot/Icm secretion system n=1 Tax=Legionella israelensis TaxID=454 RepID=A0AAX1EIF6_9GAMM|nr:LepB GTPase-activating domain-containing protein [Legionella israelensis]QBR84928.1 hypothetical protein E3983_11545 [Legionella israelensis]
MPNTSAVQYKTRILKKIAEKEGGKNHRSGYDGFYRCEQDQTEYFIKQPESKELFAELFAGLLLKEFIERGLIDPVYHDSFILADWIRLPDDSLALIQPKVNFARLSKITGTENSTESDRSAFQELFTDYGKLGAEGAWFALDESLMFSVLFGDNSVHSGNVVRLTEVTPDRPRQFARIDWGAAFRNYGHPKNNRNVLVTLEIQSLTAKHKNYYAKYQSIPGLFPSIALNAKTLQDKIGQKAEESEIPPEKLMTDIVSTALSQVPSELLNGQTQKDIAEYLGIPSFTEIDVKNKDSYQRFAFDFTSVLMKRLQKTTQLEEHTVKKAAAPNIAEVINKPESTLIDLMLTLQNMGSDLLGSMHDQIGLNEVNVFVRKFNDFVDGIARHAEEVNFWQHQKTQNILAPFFTGQKDTFYHGDAFVPHYREATIIRRLYSMLPFGKEKLEGAPRFQPYDENHLREIDDENWKKIQALLSKGVLIITMMKKIKDFKEFAKSTEELEQITIFTEQIIRDVKEFMSCYLEIENRLLSSAVSKESFESDFFYPIADEELDEMTGEQLASICMEELNGPNCASSSLVTRIVSDKKRWDKINTVLDEKAEELKRRNTGHNAKNIEQLQCWGEMIAKAKELNSSKLQIDEIELYYENLPEVLKIFGKGLIDYLTQLQEFKKTIAVTPQIDMDNSIQAWLSFTTESENSKRNKRIQFFELQQSFSKLPAILKEAYRESYACAWKKFVDFLFSEREVLSSLSGQQLAVLCLEELKLGEPDKVIAAVIGDNRLWQIMDEVIDSPQFEASKVDIQKMRNWHKQATEFTSHFQEFEKSRHTSSSRDIKKSFLGMSSAYDQLPECLQELLTQEKIESQELYKGLVSKEDKYKKALEQFNPDTPTYADFSTLNVAFFQLPRDLQKEYHESYIGAWEKIAASLKRNQLSDATTVTEKLATVKILQEGYSLLEEIGNQPIILASELDALQNYLQKLTDFDAVENGKLEAFKELQNAFFALTEDVKRNHQQDYIEARNQFVQWLRANQIPEIKTLQEKLGAIEAIEKSLDIENAKTEAVDKLLEEKELYQRLMDAAREDTILSRVINDHKEKLSKFSKAVIEDLFILKRFHDEKNQLNQNNKFGKKYTASLDGFFEETLKIRLSDSPMKVQQDQMKKEAEKQFNKRHSTRRLVADALMLIGILFGGLGLVVGGIRVGVLKTTFLFTHAPTDRENDFTALLKKEDAPQHAEDENASMKENLFKPDSSILAY